MTLKRRLSFKLNRPTIDIDGSKKAGSDPAFLFNAIFNTFAKLLWGLVKPTKRTWRGEMSAVKISQEKVKASFFFICIDPSRLNDEVLHQAIASVFNIAGVKSNKNEFFDKYIVYAETKGKAKLETDKKRWHFPLDSGEVYRFPRSLVEEKLNLKHRHEDERHRQAGSESVVPPEFLTTKTLAITIGSRKFLSLSAWLYLERYGTIREKLLSLMTDISDLAEHHAKSAGNTCIHRLIDDPNFYPGNFNELRDAVRRGRKISTTELQALFQEET